MADPIKVKPTVDTLDEVPDPWRLGYQKGADDKFHLQLDGAPAGFVPSEKLEAFRENNRALNTKLTAAEAKLAAFEGIDPVAAKEALAKPDLTTKAGELEAALAAERAAHARTTFRNTIALDFLKLGGEESAIDYAVTLAEKTFELKDGQLVTEQFSPAHPGVKLTVPEWMAQQLTTHAFLFKPSKGGGASTTKGPHTPAPLPTVDAQDPYAVGLNLEKIAKGEILVR